MMMWWFDALYKVTSNSFQQLWRSHLLNCIVYRYFAIVIYGVAAAAAVVVARCRFFFCSHFCWLIILMVWLVGWFVGEQDTHCEWRAKINTKQSLATYHYATRFFYFHCHRTETVCSSFHSIIHFTSHFFIVQFDYRLTFLHGISHQSMHGCRNSMPNDSSIIFTESNVCAMRSVDKFDSLDSTSDCNQQIYWFCFCRFCFRYVNHPSSVFIGLCGISR